MKYNSHFTSRIESKMKDKYKKQNWRDEFTTIKVLCKTCNRVFTMNYGTTILQQTRNELKCRDCGDFLHFLKH